MLLIAGKSPLLASLRLIGSTIMATATARVSIDDVSNLHNTQLDACVARLSTIQVTLPNTSNLIDIGRTLWDMSHLQSGNIEERVSSVLGELVDKLPILVESLRAAMVDVVRQALDASGSTSTPDMQREKQTLLRYAGLISDFASSNGLDARFAVIGTLMQPMRVVADLATCTDLPQCMAAFVNATPLTLDAAMVSAVNHVTRLRTLIQQHPCVILDAACTTHSDTIMAKLNERLSLAIHHRSVLDADIAAIVATGHITRPAASKLVALWHDNVDFVSAHTAHADMWTARLHIMPFLPAHDVVEQSTWFRLVLALPYCAQLIDDVLPTAASITTVGSAIPPDAATTMTAISAKYVHISHAVTGVMASYTYAVQHDAIRGNGAVLPATSTNTALHELITSCVHRVSTQLCTDLIEHAHSVCPALAKCRSEFAGICGTVQAPLELPDGDALRVAVAAVESAVNLNPLLDYNNLGNIKAYLSGFCPAITRVMQITQLGNTVMADLAGKVAELVSTSQFVKDLIVTRAAFIGILSDSATDRLAVATMIKSRGHIPSLPSTVVRSLTSDDKKQVVSVPDADAGVSTEQ